MREQRYVRLTGLANGAELRTAEFEGALQYVVPVIALGGNSIIRPLGSEGPEFVPAEELAAAPRGFNGRPCVPDHPDGGRASANEPRTLELMKFGHVFNSRFDPSDSKLKMDAWLDPARAEKVGTDAVSVIERCKAGEMVEVSVGVWVTLEKVAGTHNGQRYTAKWSGIVPDHLALLPVGAKGACSVDEGGCGAPRVASAMTKPVKTAQLRAADKERGTMADIEKDKEKAKQRNALLLSRIRLAAEDEGVSVSELREKLFVALRAVEPGFDWVQEIYPDSSTVIYTVWPEKEMLWYRRTFTLADDGEVTLNDDREQVEPVLRYEPVASVTAAAAGSGQCTCHRQSQTETAKGGGTMAAASQVSPKVKEAATRLIANARSPYVEEDRPHLEALSEDRLTALEAGFAETPAQPTPSTPTSNEETPKPAPKPSGDGRDDDDEDADTVPVSKEELTSLRRLAAKQEAQDRKRKDELVAALKGAQKVHSEASLKTLSLDRLEEIAALVDVEIEKPARGAANYIGKTMPMDDADDVAEPPDTWGLVAAREKRKQGSAAKEVN